MNDRTWNPELRYQDEIVAKSYDAARFSSLAGRVFNALEKRQVVRAFLDIPKGVVIADIPCGTGRLAEALLENGHTVLGIDISPAMLNVAQRRLARFGNRFQTKVSDIRDATETEPLFDAALCARLLVHFPLDQQILLLSRIAGLTRYRVVFTQGIDSAWHRSRHALKRVLGDQKLAPHPLTHAELVTLMDGAGLTEVARYPVLPIASESCVFVTKKRR